MPTGYPGRAAEHDLGLGHSITWDGPVLIESHLCGPSGGWHSQRITLAGTGLLAGGGPGAETLLTLAADVTCPLCGITGRIIRGRWVPA